MTTEIMAPELFASFKKGNQKAFVSIYEHYRDFIYIACYYLLKDREEAEDITLKAFTTLWKERNELKEPRHVRNYLYRISRNACLDLLKRNERRFYVYRQYQQRTLGATGTDEQLQEKERVHAEMLTRIFQTLSQLPERMRDIFILRYYGGKTVEEVAEIVGVEKRTVYNQTQNALKQLRNKLIHQFLYFLVFLW